MVCVFPRFWQIQLTIKDKMCIDTSDTFSGVFPKRNTPVSWSKVNVLFTVCSTKIYHSNSLVLSFVLLFFNNSMQRSYKSYDFKFSFYYLKDLQIYMCIASQINSLFYGLHDAGKLYF